MSVYKKTTVTVVYFRELSFLWGEGLAVCGGGEKFVGILREPSKVVHGSSHIDAPPLPVKNDSSLRSKN